ncbi:MAG: hypothetical protein KAU20_00910, partial [Nanoarchaeota archaeon]|nr:hypothetical protein [Nanoarchaeota archaeon]
DDGKGERDTSVIQYRGKSQQETLSFTVYKYEEECKRAKGTTIAGREEETKTTFHCSTRADKTPNNRKCICTGPTLDCDIGKYCYANTTEVIKECRDYPRCDESTTVIKEKCVCKAENTAINTYDCGDKDGMYCRSYKVGCEID